MNPWPCQPAATNTRSAGSPTAPTSGSPSGVAVQRPAHAHSTAGPSAPTAVLADCVKSLAERRRDRLDEPVVARPVVVVRVGRNRLRAVAGEQTGRMRSDIHARGRVVHHRAVVARRSAATESGSQRLHAVGNHGNLDPRAAEETGGVRAGGDDEGVERAGLYAPIRAFIVHRFAVYRSATPDP